MAARGPPALATTPALTLAAGRAPSQNKKKDSSRAALERYLHYYTRYTNHDNSLKLEMDAKTAMESKVKEMEALGTNTWMECARAAARPREPPTEPPTEPPPAPACGQGVR